MSWVVDASVAVKWVVPEVLSDKADLVLAAEEELLAPDLLLTEAANALWKKTVRKELSAREADRAFEVLTESRIALRSTAPPPFRRDAAGATAPSPGLRLRLPRARS